VSDVVTGGLKLSVIQKVDNQTSKTDIAYREIETMILCLELSPGDWVSENEICKQLDIGRTPVREALIKLSLAGLVEIMPRRGIRVADVDLRNHAELLIVRRTLFQLIVNLACQRATQPQCDAMRRLAAELEALQSKSEYERDKLFSRLALKAWRLIGESARNPVAGRLMEPLFGLASRLAALYSGGRTDRSGETSRDLARLLRAVAQRNDSEAGVYYNRIEDILASELAAQS
jgi:DNA-binding GntR family transcriptional regulator